jgi:RNA polymerase sigma-70 factor (ECF subfamily)
MRNPLTRSLEQGDGIAHAQERALFEALYAECFRGVYRYILARIRDVQAAEDVTSETFLRAWRRWPPRTITGLAPKAWLYRIARNLVIDHCRAANRHAKVPLDEANVCSQRGNPGRDDHLSLIAARTALTSLSSRDQDVLSLRLAGLSNGEIASVLGVGEAAAGMACRGR